MALLVAYMINKEEGESLPDYLDNKVFAGAKSVKIKKSATVSTTLKGLTKNKTYFVRIRVYKTIGSKTFNSGWSKTKNVLTLKK